MTASRGCFVVIEGPEGAGKSTLIRALCERLEQAGRTPGLHFDTRREPGATNLGANLRSIALDPALSLSPETELFLMLAARADLCREWMPKVAAGHVLLLDRFELSTFAYQVAGRGLSKDVVVSANRLATGGAVPDVTIVLDIDRVTGVARQTAQNKGLDRLEREEEAFHVRVHAAYRAAAGPGIVHLDASADPAAVADAAWRALHAVRPDIFA